MSYDTNLSYDDAASFNFDPAFVAVVASTLKLKDLGGGTFTTTPQLITSQFRTPSSGLTGFTETVATPSGTAITYQIVLNEVAVFWNSVSEVWMPVVNTFTDANTHSQINTNAATLFSDLAVFETAYLGLNVILTTTNASATPAVAANDILSSFANGNPTSINQCLVYAYLSDLVGGLPINALSKPISLIVSSEAAFLHGSKLILPFSKEVFFNSDGYVQILLIETQTPGIEIGFAFKYYDGFSATNVRLFNAIVPNVATRGINSLTTVVPFNFG